MRPGPLTVNSATSSKTTISASNPTPRSPLLRSSPTCFAVFRQHHRTISSTLNSGSRLRPSVHRIGSPSPTLEMPPHALKKSPFSSGPSSSPSLLSQLSQSLAWPSLRSACFLAGAKAGGSSLMLGVQGEWSETTVLITPSASSCSSSSQRPSWLVCERIGGQHLCRVSPSLMLSAARDR